MSDPRSSGSSSTLNLTKRRKSFNFVLEPQSVLNKIVAASLIHKNDCGTSYFWQICASLLPLTTAPVGFLGNLASIISLADPWRIKTGTEETRSDAGWLLALNSIALAAGVLANILLFLNFCSYLPHNLVQSSSIVLYMIATIIYMVMFAVTEYAYFDNSGYSRSQGYWQGASASVLYTLAAIFLTVNLVGHLTKRFNAEHYLNSNQRRVYLLSLAVIGWVAIGGAVFQALMDLSYANACYFCVISFFTLGFGDVVGKTTASRIVIIPFLYIGVLLIGVSVVALYSLLHENHVSAALVHQVRRQRHDAYNTVMTQEGFDDRDCFETVRLIMHRATVRNSIFSSLLVLLWLLIFWLLGALIYHACEGWTYFEAFYFVSIVLATVGYGDFTPKSTGGRSFFIVWTFFAIPTMTASISYLVDLVDKVLNIFVKKFRIKANAKRTMMVTLMEFFQSEVFENCADEVNTELLEGIVLALIHGEPESNYPYEMWYYSVHKLLGPLPRGFWLSESSPLVQPINERKCLLLITLHCLGMKGLRSQKVLESLLLDPSMDVPELHRAGSDSDPEPFLGPQRNSITSEAFSVESDKSRLRAATLVRTRT